MSTIVLLHEDKSDNQQDQDNAMIIYKNSCYQSISMKSILKDVPTKYSQQRQRQQRSEQNSKLYNTSQNQFLTEEGNNPQKICQLCFNSIIESKQTRKVQLEQKLKKLKSQALKKLETKGISQGNFSQKLYNKRKRERMNLLKKTKQNLLQQLQKKKKKEEQLKKILQQFSSYTQKMIDNNYLKSIIPKQMTQQNNPYFLHLKEKQISNKKLLQTIQTQKKKKSQIFLRIMDIYQFNWKKYSIKNYYCIQDSDQIFFTTKTDQKGIPILEAKKFKKIMYKKQIEQNQVEENIIVNRNKLLRILYRNSKFIKLFHNTFLRDLQLPYKMFEMKGTVLIANYYLNKQQYRNFNPSSEHTLNYLGCLQANLQYLSKAIGQSQQQFIIILQNELIQKYIQNNFEINGVASTQSQYLLQLKLQQIIKRKQAKPQYLDKQLPSFFSQNREFSQLSQKFQEQLNSLDSDQEYQILQ